MEARPRSSRRDAPCRAVEEPDAEPRYDQLTFIPWGFLNPFCTAVVQATEEAVINALIANEDMTGRDGRQVSALPRDQVTILGQSFWSAGRAG